MYTSVHFLPALYSAVNFCCLFAVQITVSSSKDDSRNFVYRKVPKSSGYETNNKSILLRAPGG